MRKKKFAEFSGQFENLSNAELMQSVFKYNQDGQIVGFNKDFTDAVQKGGASKPLSIGGIGTFASVGLLVATGLSFGWALPAIWVAGSICGAGFIGSWIGSYVARRRYNKFNKVLRNIQKLNAMQQDKSKSYSAEKYAALELKINKGLKYCVRKRMVPEKAALALGSVLSTGGRSGASVEEITKINLAEEASKFNHTFNKELGPQIQESLNKTIEANRSKYKVGESLENSRMVISMPTYIEDGTISHNADGDIVFNQKINIDLHNELECLVAPSIINEKIEKAFGQDKISFPIKINLVLNGNETELSYLNNVEDLKAAQIRAQEILNRDVEKLKIARSQQEQNQQEQNQNPNPQPNPTPNPGQVPTQEEGVPTSTGDHNYNINRDGVYVFDKIEGNKTTSKPKEQEMGA